MGTSNLTPEETPSQSRIPSAPAKPAGGQVKEKHPMFDTLQVTKELRESGFAEPQAEAIVVAFGAIAGNVATKDDLEGFATKDDLEGFATKGDLERFATKDDLKALEAKMVTKDDLKGFATKDDLKHFVTEASMLKALGEFSERMHRSLLQVAMGTVMANIAMVTAIFMVAKYLF